VSWLRVRASNLSRWNFRKASLFEETAFGRVALGRPCFPRSREDVARAVRVGRGPLGRATLPSPTRNGLSRQMWLGAAAVCDRVGA